MFKRRDAQKTDYKQRLALLKSGKHRIVVRKSLDNVRIQIIKYETDGDKTVVDVLSKKLAKYGWKGHCGNTSAAYLCGLVAALEASKKGVDSAVADAGLQISSKGSVIYAALVGAQDAGLKLNLGKENLPDIKRISGAHVAEYAKKLKADKQKYEKQFSACIRNGLEPEKMVEHFEEVKKNILKEYGFTLSKSGKDDDNKSDNKTDKKSNVSKKDTKEDKKDVKEEEVADDSDEEFEDASDGDEEFEDTK